MPTSDPEQGAVLDGRIGLRGFASLYTGAAERLRRSDPLRGSFLRWTGVGLILTVPTSAGIALLHGSGTAGVLLAAIGWWLVVSAIVFGGAPLLRTPDQVLIDHYGLPNGLTALRAYVCLPLLLCAILSLPHQLGLILWCVVGGSAAMLDVVDGMVARRVGPITELGQAMDPAMDSLFFSMAAVGNVALGIIPAWLMALLLVRYLGPLLATPVVLLSRRRPELVHTSWGRRNTALTGLVLFLCMWTRLLHREAVDLVALILGVPLLATTTALHFWALGQRTYRAPVVRQRARRDSLPRRR